MRESKVVIALPIPESIVGVQRIIEHSIINKNMLLSYTIRAWEIRHKVNEEFVDIVMGWVVSHIYDGVDGVDYDKIANGIAEQMMCSLDKANDIIIDTTFAKITLLLNKLCKLLDRVCYHLIDPNELGYGVSRAELLGHDSIVIVFEEIP